MSNQLSWINPKIKKLLRKKNRAFKSFLNKGQLVDTYASIQDMTARGSKLADDAKRKYFNKIHHLLSDPLTGTKSTGL